MSIYKPITRKKGYTFNNINIFKSKEFRNKVIAIDDARYQPIVGIPTLTLLFDDISNADLMVGDALNVSDWNTYFDLPTNGSPFIDVIISGNNVTLNGGSNIHLKNFLFSTIGYEHLLEFIDTGCVVTAGNYVFNDWNIYPSIAIIEKIEIPLLTTAGEGCFVNLLQLNTITLPLLTTVGHYCFNWCPLVEIFDFPLLTNISDSCFQDCYAATSFNSPLVTTINGYAFSGCTSITSFNFPLITTVPNNCFYQCSSLTSFNSPLVTTMGSACFLGCVSLTSINFPLLTICLGSTFAACTSLTSFNLPLLVTAGDYCFGGSFKSSFSLPSLTTAGDNCFQDCQSLTTITLFNFPLLTTVGENCFYRCSSLTSVSLSSVTQVRNWCFQFCTSLTSLSLPVCTNLGTTVGNNNVFNGIIGNTIALTVKAPLMTCNGGSPDGDIVFLQASNTVTIVTV